MRKNAEKGQAIVELCTGLVGLLLIVLGMIFVAGLCTSNIKLLLSSKSRVDRISQQQSSADQLVRPDILSWNYGSDDIPFDANDFPVYNTNDGESEYYGYLNDEMWSWSNPNLSDDPELQRQYSFTNYQFRQFEDIDLRTTRYPETSRLYEMASTSFATMANLLCGTPDSIDSIYTLRKSDAREREALLKTFRNLYGVNVSSSHLRSLRSNQAYMPQLPAHQPLSLPVPSEDDN